MKHQTQIHSDSALEDKPDARHAPEPAARDDKLGETRGKGRTGLRPGGESDAEQMLDRQNLERSRDRS
ncbi:hypothetical protein Herbaro_21140 [Herbaspirillum sp. WKF16]|uniref:hypothetical protein n=1 Tax=Herbaspirillum sp. WKF16 TaxID=3028312 RepID=UPI0023A95FE4|nr:hypothetical protein [Herbaspirillum sp. WKF16]WDZ95950.1 hypothetical protein Herbaro_21140 [Herbaspirillum sp. WKF16]